MMFEELKRYEPVTELGPCGDDYDVDATMEEDKDGEFVKLYDVKQRVKEAIIKFTQGTKYIRHEDCSRPYGDDCGYCEFCLQRQKELQNKIFEELGFED